MSDEVMWMVDVVVEICDLVGVGANLNTRVTTISVLRMARWGREEYLETRAVGTDKWCELLHRAGGSVEAVERGGVVAHSTCRLI